MKPGYGVVERKRLALTTVLLHCTCVSRVENIAPDPLQVLNCAYYPSPLWKNAELKPRGWSGGCMTVYSLTDAP